jgi:hypothetical protein
MWPGMFQADAGSGNTATVRNIRDAISDRDTGCCWTTRDNNIQLETHEFSGEGGDAIEFPLRISLLNDDIFALGVSKLL